MKRFSGVGRARRKRFVKAWRGSTRRKSAKTFEKEPAGYGKETLDNGGQRPIINQRLRHFKRRKERIMEIRNIRTGESVGIAILLTALFCWHCRDNRSLSYGTIHEAAANGNLAEVKSHLQKGVDVNAKNAQGATPLVSAAMNGHKDVAELLIAKGGDVKAKDKDGWTPLHWAVRKGQRDLVELFLAKGARVNAKGVNNMTPLHWATQEDDMDLAELLIVKGADVNAKGTHGMTPLHWAAQEGYVDMAELLIAKGAAVNAKDDEGRRPLRVASGRPIMRLLREHGARE
jgi:ankyrin repeat protein